jgi:hypothetical protein
MTVLGKILTGMLEMRIEITVILIRTRIIVSRRFPTVTLVSSLPNKMSYLVKLRAPSISLRYDDNIFSNSMANKNSLLRNFDCSRPKCKKQIFTCFLLHNLLRTVIHESVKMLKLVYKANFLL